MTNQKFIRPYKPIELRTRFIWTHLPNGAFGEFQLSQNTVGEIRIEHRYQSFELTHLFVEPGWRRRGIGSVLLLYGVDLTFQAPYNHQSGYPTRIGNLLIPVTIYDGNPLFFDAFEQTMNRPLSRDEILNRFNLKLRGKHRSQRSDTR